MTESIGLLGWVQSGSTERGSIYRNHISLKHGTALASRLFLAAIGGLVIPREAIAADILHWDTNIGSNGVQGGAGTWDATTDNWLKDGNAPNVDWATGSVPAGGIARFGGAGGVVTLSGPQKIDGLIFAGSGYEIKPADAASTLELNAATVDIRANNGVTATISAVISDTALGGVGGVSISGSGKIIFNGTNTYGGDTNVSTNSKLELTGNGAIAGKVINNGSFNIDAGGVVSGQVVNNGGLVSSGTINNFVFNSGSFNNNSSGLINGGAFNTNSGTLANNDGATIKNGVTNQGTLISTGTINGGLINGYDSGSGPDSGKATVSGTLLGAITNDFASTLTISGALTANGSLTNNGTSIVTVNSGATTGITTLINNSTALKGVEIKVGASLSAASVVNSANSTISNSGTLTSAGIIQNNGALNNAGSGTINGGISNAGSLTNGTNGVINGGVSNTGTLVSTGTITGGLTNSGSGAANLNGAMNGFILNQDSSKLNLGFLTVNNSTLTNTGKASVLVLDKVTGISTLTNSSTAATGLKIDGLGSLEATNVINDAGASIVNSGTLKATTGIENKGKLGSTGTLAGAVANTGTLTSTGTLDGSLTNGSLTSAGTVSISGIVKGAIVNQNNSSLSITAALNGSGQTLTNTGTATVLVQAGATVGISTLTNSSTAATGLKIEGPASLEATNVINDAGASIVNSGTLKGTGGIDNKGKLDSTGTLAGAVANTGTLLSTGTLDGVLTNGSLTNAGTASISGIVKGAIVNQNSSSLTITGALDAKNNTLTNTGAATVAVTAGATTGISALTNSSSASVGLAVGKDAKLSADKISNAAGSAIYNGGTLASGTVIQNSGAISNDTAGIINGGINNIGGLNSLGTINGDIANSGGFNNFGTVNGALTVSAGGSLGGAGGTLASLLLDGGSMVAGSSQTVKGDTTQNAGSVMAGSIIGPGAGLYLMTGGSLTGSVSKYGSFVQEGGNLAAGSNISVDAFGSTGGTDSGANITAHLRAVASDGKIGPLSVAQSNISNNVGGISFVSDGVTTLGSAGVTAVTTVTKAAGPTDIVVNAGMTGFRGIDAAALGGGAISIKTVGPIVTASTAISMQTAGGAGVAEVLGNVSVSGADAAFVGGGNATFNIGNGVTVKAASLLNSVSGQTTLKNAGTVEAQSLSSGGGGSVVVDNLTSGIVNLGGISLSNFAGANDAFNNSGILNAAGTVSLGGLENFSNLSTGIISLGNGVGGDKLLLGGNLNLGASQVFMDVDLSQSQNAAVNDIIILDGTHGVLSGNGAVLHLNDTSKSVPNIGFVGPTLIRGASIDPGSTFVITGLSDAGFFEYGLVQNGGNLDLSSKIREQVAGGIVSNFITAQNAVSSAFFKPSSSFVSTPVNPEPNQFGFAPWFRTSGGLSRIGSQGVAILPSGTAQSVASSVNVGFGGYQFGMDTGLFNIAGKGGNVHIGLTAGQIFGSATQVGYNNKTGMTDTFVGAYGVFSNGPFFVDALLRQEFIDYTVNVDDLLFRIDGAKVKAKRFSAGVSGGYAFKLNDWSIVPAAGYTYARTTTGDLNIVGNGTSQSSVITSFADTESHLAFAGISASRSFLLFDDKLRLSPFISATAYHDFGKANEAQLKVVSSPGNSSTFDVSSRNGTTYGEVSLGANFLALTPKFGGAERLLSGNIRGDVQFGKERLGGSLNMQMRLQF